MPAVARRVPSGAKARAMTSPSWAGKEKAGATSGGGARRRCAKCRATMQRAIGARTRAALRVREGENSMAHSPSFALRYWLAIARPGHDARIVGVIHPINYEMSRFALPTPFLQFGLWWFVLP